MPTRCEPWNVKQLLAHMLRAVWRIPTAVEGETPDAADTDAVTYFTAYDPQGDAQRIADHAVEIAADFSSGTALVDAFDAYTGTWLSAVAGEAPDRVIRLPWGPTMELDEFLKTRVLEIVVHGIDMTDALRRTPIATPEGLAVVTSILDGLLRFPPVRELSWQPVEYIRKATGRSALTSSDVEILGSSVAAFSKLR